MTLNVLQLATNHASDCQAIIYYIYTLVRSLKFFASLEVDPYTIEASMNAVLTFICCRVVTRPFFIWHSLADLEKRVHRNLPSAWIV